MITPIVLPGPLQSSLEVIARVLLESGDPSHIDFSRPVGEAALLSPESISWRVFKNPLSLFIGGVTAVIMELAEPRVRAGVWEHTTFRLDPIRRLRRTGLAAMVTVYGARSTAEALRSKTQRGFGLLAEDFEGQGRELVGIALAISRKLDDERGDICSYGIVPINDAETAQGHVERRRQGCHVFRLEDRAIFGPKKLSDRHGLPLTACPVTSR